MAMKLKGLTATLSTLDRKGHQLTAAARLEFDKGATDIQNLARQMAPVDHGDLEAAIQVSPMQANAGVVSRKVFISDMGINRDDVNKYAPKMHEGSYNLGPKSLAKQAASGVMVGPKFLTRAAKQLFPKITAAISAAMRRSV